MTANDGSGRSRYLNGGLVATLCCRSPMFSQGQQGIGSGHALKVAHALLVPGTLCRARRLHHFEVSTVSSGNESSAASQATGRRPLRHRTSSPARRRVPWLLLLRRPAQAPGCDVPAGSGHRQAPALRRPHRACCSHSDERSRGCRSASNRGRQVCAEAVLCESHRWAPTGAREGPQLRCAIGWPEMGGPRSPAAILKNTPIGDAHAESRSHR